MKKSLSLLGLLLVIALPLQANANASSPDVELEIISRDLAYDGATFGDYGPYERVSAIAHMRINPESAGNKRIVDLALAPRNADGLVEYDIDVVILRPRDVHKARRVLVYEVVNRGIKLLSMMNRGSPASGVDPIDPGDGFLMRQGYSMVWSGWQGDISRPGFVGARFPIASRTDGPITGRVSTEKIFDDADSYRIDLPYPAVTVDKSAAVLTVRARSDDAPVIIGTEDWAFGDEHHITLKRPAGMDAGAIYRFSYIGRDPRVMGLGFAATRDLIAFLRHGSGNQGNPFADLASTPCERTAEGDCANARGGVFSSVVAFGISQSGRYLRDFLWQDFNRDDWGRRVFDGVITMVPGARLTFTNFRFAEQGRFSRQHEDHDVPGFTFPFTYATLTDPVTGRRDGVLRNCSHNGTCPRLFHVDTGAEFWQAAASLVGTGGSARDVDFPDNVRAYMIASGSHAPTMAPDMCRLPANPMLYTPVVRALLQAMVEWSIDGKSPPDSRWPRLNQGELQTEASLRGPAVPAAGLHWPTVLNEPETPPGRPDWPVFVPAIDDDGNDLPGIRMPELAAPTGTYLGWNLRKEGFAEGELCHIFGGFVPFAMDAARRGDDPRLSMAERYSSDDARAKRFFEAVDALRRDGLLLEEDARRLEP